MPLLNISLWEAYQHALEAGSGGRNTVIFDDLNLPSVMVRIPAFSVEDIDADLGAGSHPAFLVNTVQKSHFSVGMYNSYVYGTRAYSLPYKDPTCSLDFDASKARCTAKGAGWHLTSNWEAAALALLCVKNGQPSGNTDYGRHHTNKQQTGVRQDGILPGTASGTARTLTGSGPAAWRHDGTMQGVSDLVGNVWEWTDGLKLSTGKIYMPTDNYYALAEGSWPTDNVIIANDSGLKLGVSGTDTLHTSGSGTWASGIGRTAAYTALSAAIKSRYMQAMIDPFWDIVNPVGGVWWDCSGERIPRRFGTWSSAGLAGVAALNLSSVRSGVGTGFGCRPAYIG